MGPYRDAAHRRAHQAAVAARRELAGPDRHLPRIERRREHKDRCSREVVYAITSLPADKLDPAALLRLSRDHWQIENCLFHVRDVTFKEDASRVRTGSAPQVMAELRNATLTVIRKRGLKPRAARQAYAARPKAALRDIMTS